MYEQLINKFNLLSILVIGDVMIDRYLKGSSTRLSPEGPVPVVDILETTSTPGGGANTALNLRSLGAKVTFCSVTGRDEDAQLAMRLLEEAGVEAHVVQDEKRQTIVKTRVMADGQLLTRYDSGTESALSTATEEVFTELLQRELPRHHAIVISDYNKGLLTPEVIRFLQQAKAERNIFIAVDSKRMEQFSCLEPALIKPNYSEAIQLLQLQKQPDRHTQLRNNGKDLHKITKAAITAVTMDEDGAMIFDGENAIHTASAHPVQHPNVVGAGDVYISAFTLAHLAGADIAGAADIAGTAAAVAVGKSSTACCSQPELLAWFSMQQKYLYNMQQAAALSSIYKAQGKKVVFTNGCFDILHSGHVSYLQKARELGHVLIVGINKDDSIKRLKGRQRPINQLADRMQVLAALEAVTHIIPFGDPEDDTPCALINAIQPDVFAKGGDYSIDDLPEAALVEQLGGCVHIIPQVPGRSTSSVIRRINTPIITVKHG